MKNKIFTLMMMLFLCIFSISTANAQITSYVSDNDLFTVIDKWATPWTIGSPGSNLIYSKTDNKYILRVHTLNEFEDNYIMIPLGKTKEEAIQTATQLYEIAKCVKKKNPYHITLNGAKPIHIYHFDGIKYWIDQDGIAKSRYKHCSLAISSKVFLKVAKAIKKFNQQDI